MLFGLSLFAAQPWPIAVEVTGMAPQIALVEEVARAEGWTQLCSGRAGEETVLRFALPTGTTEESVLQTLGGQNHFVSSFGFFEAGETLPATCDREPIRSEGEPATVLALGTVAALAPQLEIARACGLRGAYIRDRKKSDLPGNERTRPDVKTLDAGENLVARYGPSMCYVQMRDRKR